MKSSKVTGIVLAGGQSHRMGENKALMEIGGKPLVRYPLDLLSRFCSEVFLVTKLPDLYRRLNVRIVTDIHSAAGPMAGIYAGLQNASNRWSVVLACDMPYVRQNLLRSLIDRLEMNSSVDSLQAVIPLAPEKPGGELVRQVLCALYSKDCLPLFAKKIDQGKISLKETMEEPHTRYIHWLELDAGDREAVSFRNLNTPDEFKDAQKSQNEEKNV